jgi:hypothetical protein
MQFWTAIYAKAKLIDPFIRLAKPQGALASTALQTFYLSSNLTPHAVVAFFKGHWFILLATLVYTAVGFLAPLASEMVFLDTNWACKHPDLNNENNPCWPPKISIDIVVARAVQGLLIFVAVMTITIMVMTFRMPTGLYSDPSSIVSVASLVHHPEVLEDFRNIDPEASLKEIMRHLGDRRMKLDEYERHDGVWRYGLVPAMPTDFRPRDSHRSSGPSHRWKWVDSVVDAFFCLLLLGLLAVVVAYFKDGSGSGSTTLLNSNSFGTRFLLTGAGLLVAMNWKRLERGKTVRPASFGFC